MGLLYALNRLLHKVSPQLGIYVYELMVQPITDKPLLPANLTRHLSFAEIDQQHPDIALMPAREAIKQARFEQGARCLGVYSKGKLLGYLWFCTEQYHEDEVRCSYILTVAQESVFDFDLFIFPEYRMGIGFIAIWHGANQYFTERGIRYTFSRLTRFNLASRRAHAHLGWRRIARAVFLKAWRVEIMAATLFPYLALTWAPDQRILLRLAPNILAASGAGRMKK